MIDSSFLCEVMNLYEYIGRKSSGTTVIFSRLELAKFTAWTPFPQKKIDTDPSPVHTLHGGDGDPEHATTTHSYTSLVKRHPIPLGASKPTEQTIKKLLSQTKTPQFAEPELPVFDSADDIGDAG